MAASAVHAIRPALPPRLRRTSATVDWEIGRSVASPSPSTKRTFAVLAVHDLEIRVGARVLMSDVSFRVSPGDKVGLVGRNGAGKTTLTKVLAGDLLPADGRVDRIGRARLPAAGPAHGRPRDARAHAHPRRPRPGYARARHARGIASPMGDENAGCRRQGDEALQQPHRAFRGRSAATRPRPRRHPSPTTSRCPTASSISRCARSRADSAGASSWRASCSRTPTR